MTGYNSIFTVTDEHNNFHFTKSINVQVFSVVSTPKGVYELNTLSKEIIRNTIDGGQFTEATYPFANKSNFSTLDIS